MEQSQSRPLPIKIWKSTSSGQHATFWDGLRRDPDLWYQDADCLVYFHHEGQSRRGPSIQIPYEALLSTSCAPIAFSRDTKEVSCVRNTPHKVKLYLAPPSNIPLAEAQRWNITTRNFFAWMLAKPLVGHHLGPALEDLLARMKLFRGQEVDNLQDLLTYSERLGYLDFVGQPENALAMLYFAEKQQLRSLWIDAFAHCMGMDPHLAYCSEIKPINQSTRSNLTRTHLTVQLKIERGLVSLGNLLEKEISTSIQLDAASAAHANEFRLFLHSYFIAHYGQWPPSKDIYYPRIFLDTMRADLETLYSYLADHGDVTKARVNSLHNDGICLKQCIGSLDKYQNWDPLPCSSSLLPQMPVNEPESSSSLKFFKNTKANKRERRILSCVRARLALQQASNRSDDHILASTLVQAFDSFECEEFIASGDFISLAEGRKIRWLLVYGLLQKLISLTTAPAEVSDSLSALYPLCCGSSVPLPWEEKVSKTPLASSNDVSPNEAHHEPASPMESKPPLSRSVTLPYFEPKHENDLAQIQITQSGSAVSSQSEKSSDPLPPKRRSTLSILPRSLWLKKIRSNSSKPSTSPKSSSTHTSWSLDTSAEGPSESDRSKETADDIQEIARQGDDEESAIDSEDSDLSKHLQIAPSPSAQFSDSVLMVHTSDVSCEASSENLSAASSRIMQKHRELSAPASPQDPSTPSSSSSASSISGASPITEQSPEDYLALIPNDQIGCLLKDSSIRQRQLWERIATSLPHNGDDVITEPNSPREHLPSQANCILRIPHCQCTAASA